MYSPTPKLIKRLADQFGISVQDMTAILENEDKIQSNANPTPLPTGYWNEQ